MTLCLHADVSTVDTEDAMVLLDQCTGRYFQLNSTGADALRAILAGESTEQAAQRLSHSYSVPVKQAAADIASLIAHLRGLGLAAG